MNTETKINDFITTTGFLNENKNTITSGVCSILPLVSIHLNNKSYTHQQLLDLDETELQACIGWIRSQFNHVIINQGIGIEALLMILLQQKQQQKQEEQKKNQDQDQQKSDSKSDPSQDKPWSIILAGDEPEELHIYQYEDLKNLSVDQLIKHIQALEHQAQHTPRSQMPIDHYYQLLGLIGFLQSIMIQKIM
jgi:hypothetical protein